MMPLRAQAVTYCLINIVKETSGSWCSVRSSQGATFLNTLMHTAMAMGTAFFVQERPEDRHSSVCCMSAVFVCVNVWRDVCEPMELRVVFPCAYNDTECNKQGRASVVVVLSNVLFTQPSSLSSSLSATLFLLPVSRNSGLIPSPSIIFLFLQHPSSYFPLSYRLVALSSRLSLCLLSPPLSPLPAPLPHSCFSFSPRLFPSLLPSLSAAASMSLCVNSWDAFVEGFHSDEPFEQVVIHVCTLERGHVISPRHTGRPVPLNHHNCYPATSKLLRIFELKLNYQHISPLFISLAEPGDVLGNTKCDRVTALP